MTATTKRVLEMALAELLHLGAEDRDIDGVKRQSEACDAIRALLKLEKL